MIRPLGGPRRGRLDQVTTARPSATELDARTPADRDRVIDAVRAASILVVVLGHWTMAAPERVEGSLRLRNVLEVATWAQPLTWLLQVMPLFFLAAGFANHRSLAPRADGTRRPAAAYLAGRVDRVLRPTLIFLAVWLVGAWVAVALGAPERALDAAGTAAAMPLWFLAIYLLLALLAPAQLAVHRRWPLLLPTVLPVGVLLLDQAQGTGWAALAFLNYALVFGLCQELGFWYADGRLQRLPRLAWVACAAAAVALLLVATQLGDYPVSMIGLPGQKVSNMMPPSICVVLVALLQLSLLMLLRPALARWLQRPGPWAATVGVNLRIMTVFLWHLSGFAAAAGILLALDVPLPAIASGAWWAWKLVWIALSALVTVAFVLALGRAEQGAGQVATPPAPLAVLGTAVAFVGLVMVACAGFVAPFEAGGIELVGMRFVPAVGAALVVVGYALTRAGRTTAAPSPTR